MWLKRLTGVIAGIAMAAVTSGIAYGGSVGIQRAYAIETYPQYMTTPQIVDALEQASQRDADDARNGNKNGAEFTQKSVEANDLANELAGGYPVTVAEVDDALMPVHVW
ncbi:MAG TPA: hypothetical protein VMU41_11180 [Candidatus Binataceae bacterium]|nr:hypothetical protein [Candidatus Binataceae bacterium]